MTNSDYQLQRMVISLKDWIPNKKSLISEMTELATVNPSIIKHIKTAEEEGRYDLGTTEKVMRNIRPALSIIQAEELISELTAD